MNQEIIIEKNIPISPDGRGGARYTKYPFAKMEVGDSFQVEFVKKKCAPPASSCAYLYGKRTKTKWTSRVTKVDGKHFVRVWRIK